MMHAANTWASPVLDALWRASWQGGIFVATIWIACKVFQRMPAWAKHWLWWVACLQMAVRLFVCISVPILPMTEISADSVAIGTKASIPVPMESARPITHPAISSLPSQALAQLIPSPTPQEKPSIELLLVAGWLLGCLAALSLTLRHLFALRRLLRRSEAPNVVTAGLVQSLATSMKLSAPRIRISKDAPCPMLAGWLRPTIILPEWAAELAESELNLALHHELIHLKRHDLWMALLPASVKCLFFFHPLAWLAAHEASLACEEACDLETLILGSGSPATYARLLLHSAQTKSSVVALGTAFGFRSLHRRITMLKRLNLSAPARRTRSLTIFIALAAVCALPWSVTAQSTKGTHSAHHRKSHRRAAHRNFAKVIHDTQHTSSKAKVAKANSTELATIEVDAAAATPNKVDKNIIVRPFKGLTLVNPAGAANRVDGWVLVDPATKTKTIRRVDGDTIWQLPAAPQASIGGAGITTAPASPRADIVGDGGGFVLGAPTREQEKHGGTSGGQADGGGAGGTVTRTAPASGGFGGGGGMGAITTLDTQSHVTSDDNGKVTVKFKNVNLREALAQLFEAAHVDFTIKSNVSFNETVTCGFTHASLQTVVSAMLDSVDQPLAYHVEGGTYIIMAKDNTETPVPTPSGG